MSAGKFIISLDFELMWGMNDATTVEKYGKHIAGVHTAIPRLLKVFDGHQVKATFSIVGFLFFETKEQLIQNIPAHIPHYTNKTLTNYTGYLDKIGDTYQEDLYHFAPDLIELIKRYPNQEIGTHTFSHYYCLEEGQTKEDFRADIKQAQKIALEKNINLSSLVFPRNQYNDEYLQVCKELGIICTRGNELSWMYKAKSGKNQNVFYRLFRLADSYINLTGHNCYAEKQLSTRLPVNLPASKFLRPYSASLKSLEGLRLRRIKNAMTVAAKKGLMYHLWWHPHNFGVNQNENFNFLEQILEHYGQLNKAYGFESHTMTSAAKKILNSYRK